MELKSVSSLTFYVADLDKTAAFYKSLGFRIGEQEPDHVTVYLNWFSIKFVPIDGEDKPGFKEDAQAERKGEGCYFNIKVADVDEFYQGVLKLGLKPSSEPHDWPWGNREFVLRDPDGYKLVIWNKK